MLGTAVALVLACGSGSTPSDPAPDKASEPAKSPAASESGPTASEPSPTPALPEPTPENKAPTLPAPPSFNPGPFEIRIGKAKPTPPSGMFPIVRTPEDMQDHAWAFGWTADGKAFAYCTVVSGAECELCTFVSLDESVETLSSGEECDDGGATKLSAKQLKERLKERGVMLRDGEWAHGGELVATTREVAGRPDDFGTKRSTLVVGAGRRDGSVEGDAVHEDGCAEGEGEGSHCFVDAHPDVIAASPDGASVAILGHFWEGEFSDTFVLTIVPAGRLAAASYNREGLDALGRSDFEAAATAFLAAMHADPSAWKGPYNLACAYARAADPRAQPALEEAVVRGGDVVREKAKKDPDLDSVRAQAWFKTSIE